MKKLEKAILDVFSDRSLEKYAEKLLSQIKRRVRAGMGIAANGRGQMLNNQKRLSKSYLEQRKKYSRNLGKFARPSFQNATATGQLIDSIKYKIVNKNIIFTISGSRSIELNGKSSRLTNDQVLKFYEEQGRKFFGLTDFEVEFLLRMINEEINIALDKI